MTSESSKTCCNGLCGKLLCDGVSRCRTVHISNEDEENAFACRECIGSDIEDKKIIQCVACKTWNFPWFMITRKERTFCVDCFKETRRYFFGNDLSEDPSLYEAYERWGDDLPEWRLGLLDATIVDYIETYDTVDKIESDPFRKLMYERLRKAYRQFHGSRIGAYRIINNFTDHQLKALEKCDKDDDETFRSMVIARL